MVWHALICSFITHDHNKLDFQGSWNITAPTSNNAPKFQTPNHPKWPATYHQVLSRHHPIWMHFHDSLQMFFDPKSFAPETCGLLTAQLRKHVVQVSDFHLGGYLDVVVEKIATRGFCKQLCKTKWIGFSLHLICFWVACNFIWEPPWQHFSQGQPTKKFMKNVNYTLWHEHLRLYTTRLSLFIPKLNNKKRHFC